MDPALVLAKLTLDNESDLDMDDMTFLLEGIDQRCSAAAIALAHQVRHKYVSDKTYFRGLIELSNFCYKNCLYCGIRRDNSAIRRYQMDREEILDACRFAHVNGYGSVVLQSGENTNHTFIQEISSILRAIKSNFDGSLRVTLSCGEQSDATYQQWFADGAHRYLLRIETSNETLYDKIHPNDGRHNFAARLSCLKSLRSIGYQVGSGIMVGLPGQTYSDIARDLLFLKKIDIDMAGLGPYIGHENTPLYQESTTLWSLKHRLDVAVRAVAILRIIMKDINIASATALQAIDPLGREKALEAGANVIMPNLTPTIYRKEYALYANIPCMDEDRSMCSKCLEGRVQSLGLKIAKNEWGDSRRYTRRR